MAGEMSDILEAEEKKVSNNFFPPFCSFTIKFSWLANNDCGT